MCYKQVIHFYTVNVFSQKTLCGGRCDRILWYGKGIKQLSYFRSESRFSDHRPVSALFSTQVEIVKSSSPGGTSKHTVIPNIVLIKHDIISGIMKL